MAYDRDSKSKLSTVNFICSCGNKFACDPGRIEDAPERHHPYVYFATCDYCGDEASQAPWEKALMASYGKHTGPKTEEGKAAVTANLDGHPTPEEAKRTRFNAMTHGLYSRVATYFPAKPGAYAHCDTCDIDHDVCRGNVACMKRTELFMKHQIAFETKDPNILNDIYSDMHSNISAIISDILIVISRDGVALRNPAYDFDKDGGFHLAQYLDSQTGELTMIEEVKAHPLLKVLSEFLSRNDMSLSNMAMTPKIHEGNELVMGNLADEKEDREKLISYQQEQVNQLTQLKDLISKSQKRINEDPVLIEHNNG